MPLFVCQATLVAVSSFIVLTRLKNYLQCHSFYGKDACLVSSGTGETWGTTCKVYLGTLRYLLQQRQGGTSQLCTGRHPEILLVIVSHSGWAESGEKCAGTVFQADTTSSEIGLLFHLCAKPMSLLFAFLPDWLCSPGFFSLSPFKVMTISQKSIIALLRG